MSASYKPGQDMVTQGGNIALYHSFDHKILHHLGIIMSPQYLCSTMLREYFNEKKLVTWVKCQFGALDLVFKPSGIIAQ